MNFKWPLNINNFSILDRIKICLFFLSPFKRWTQDKFVSKFEQEMSSFVGAKYSVFCSSGSAANTIFAMYLKDKYKNTEKNTIILPSVTWQTSCSPFIREGFNVEFVDISLDNFCIDSKKLVDLLENNHKNIACVAITSLLGFHPDVNFLEQLKLKFNVEIFIDNCEANFAHFNSTYASHEIFNKFTSTTSTYFGHQLQSVEGGFIFTNSEEEYEKFLMYRNHGMVRSLDNRTFLQLNKLKYSNKNVDPRFDFYLLGNNFRNSDIHAFIGLLDFRRRFKYIRSRRKLYSIFKNNLDLNKYILPPDSCKNSKSYFVPFCLPIIFKDKQPEVINFKKNLALQYCENNCIETRPIISGFLGYQTAYKNLINDKENNYSVSKFIHLSGFYIGLHSKVKEKDIINLCIFLNQI